MKQSIIIGLFLVSFTGSLLAQSGEVVRIKAGEDPAAVFSPNGFYRFTRFNDGVAIFKNGGKTTARFNYHLLNQEMQFLAENGDTLSLADPFSIKSITMDSNLFYYSNGYLEVMVNHEHLKLGKKIKLDVSAEKIGAYGQASPSGSIRSPNKLILQNTGKNLSLNQDLLIRKEFSYYWLDEYNIVLKATKANLLKLLPPDKKNNIEEYLRKNKIDFTKEEDLKKLLQYSVTNG